VAVDSAIDAAIEHFRGSSNAENAIRQAVRVPEVYPPIVRLLFGQDYALWIEQRPQGEQLPYYVVERDGTPVGTLHLPRSQRLLAADEGRIWVVDRDDLGVESLIQYGVRWESTPP
jgi:hypothetical protein